MKTTFIRLTICFAIFTFSANLNAQKKKNYDKIMTSTSIAEIEDFMANAHPDDPRRLPLKRKLVTLKNQDWTKGAKDAKPMAARPLVTELEIPKSVMKNSHSDEAEEFKKLVAESSSAKSEKTVKLLNTLFDQDVTSKEAILLVQNNSDCNLIIRIQGNEYYNLAVPAHGENSIVLTKGLYKLNSNMCDLQYISEKDIKKSTIIILNKPVYQKKETK